LSAALHLVGPLGFDVSQAAVKRAGLDYWDMVDMTTYSCLQEVESRWRGAPVFLVSTRGSFRYDAMRYRRGSWLVFGKETQGLPQDLLERYPDSVVRLPMRLGARSLNLANTVAVVAYEAMRQMRFTGLE